MNLKSTQRVLKLTDKDIAGVMLMIATMEDGETLKSKIANITKIDSDNFKLECNMSHIEDILDTSSRDTPDELIVNTFSKRGKSR